MIPLTVISGYLGSGKTHLVNRLLMSSRESIGVCVNDFGELNIDAALIKNRRGKTVELTNGCVCCQLTDDLGAALEELRHTNITRVVIEASGVALPEKIAAYGRNWPGYQLHKTYALVDASNIHHWLDDKYVGTLVAAQMQQADELLITKLDLVNPTAKQHWTWQRDSRSAWQVLPKDSLTQAQVAALFAPRQTGAQSSVQANAKYSATSIHTPDLVATCHAGSEPVSDTSLRGFLRANPHIVRAKGWFTDAQQHQYLLQHVAEQTNIEGQPTGQTAPNLNGLVFLHHKSTTLDLTALIRQPEPAPTS